MFNFYDISLVDEFNMLVNLSTCVSSENARFSKEPYLRRLLKKSPKCTLNLITFL